MNGALTSNSIALVDREIASGAIEGVYFGPRVWVIARSPSAVLIWVYGHSASINGHQRYYCGHLTLLPDRTPRFLYNPSYKDLRRATTRLMPTLIAECRSEIESAFGDGSADMLAQAVKERRTVLIDGGGGPLKPLNLYGNDYHDWIERNGNGFVIVPEGTNPHDMYRHKLGWKPL